MLQVFSCSLFLTLGSTRLEPILYIYKVVILYVYDELALLHRLYREQYWLADTLSIMTCGLAIKKCIIENKNLMGSIFQHEPCPNYLPCGFLCTQAPNVH